MQCQAKKRGTSEQCRAQAVTGRRVCRIHGGATPRGPALPQYKDGRYSKDLPKRLFEDYAASQNDPNKLALDAELAVIDARISDVLRRVDTGESGRLWRELRQSWRAVQEARRPGGDVQVLADAMARHDALMSRGHADWRGWAEVADLIERRRKLVDSERKRLVAAQQLIHVEQAMALLGLMVEAVRRHVRDDAALRAVTNEYARLTGQPSPAAALSHPAGTP